MNVNSRRTLSPKNCFSVVGERSSALCLILLAAACFFSDGQIALAAAPPETVTTKTETVQGKGPSQDGTLTSVRTQNNETHTLTIVSTDVLAAGGTRTTNETMTTNPDGSSTSSDVITLPNGQTETTNKTSVLGANGVTTITGTSTADGQTQNFKETLTPVVGGISTTDTVTNAQGQTEVINRTVITNPDGSKSITGSTTLFNGQVDQYNQTVTPTVNGGSITVTTVTNARGQQQITRTIVTINGNITTVATSGTNFNGSPQTPTVTSTDVTSTQKTSTANGQCGPANGVSVAAAPTVGLCSTGNPSAVSGSGPFTWSCIGIEQGTTALCSAPVTAPLSFTINAISAMPTSVQAGKSITFTATITANQTVSGYPVEFSYGPGTSGSSNGVVFTDFQAGVPTTKAMSWTVPSSTTPGPFALFVAVYNPSWTQQFTIGTASFTVTGSAVNGAVGAAENQSFPSLTSTSPNLCSTGTVTNFTPTSTGWTWSCQGSNGGTTDNSGSANLVAVPEVPGPSAALLANPTYGQGIGTVYQCVTNYYVDGAAGNDSYDGTSKTFVGGTTGPWATIQHADTLTRQGGDCINVAPGTYTWTAIYNGWTGFKITKGGTSASPTGYVAYRCESLDACKLSFAVADPSINSPGDVIAVAAPYLVIDGFEIDGGDESVYGGYANTCVDSTGADASVGHHIWVLNNKVHGCALGGINLSDAEWYFTIHNEVYDNSWTSGYQGSGIGYVTEKELGSNQPNSYAFIRATMPVLPPYPAYAPTAQDSGFAPFHMLILWNKVHDNACTTCLGSSVAGTFSGTTTAGSSTLTIEQGTSISPNQLVVGPTLPPITYVAAVSGTSVTLTRPALATGNASFTFVNVVGGHTDGNGIILDTWCPVAPNGNCGIPDSQNPGGNIYDYPDQTLVAFNDVENNGGQGIHVFASGNVTVANNSTYSNGLDLMHNGYRDEIDSNGGHNNSFFSNIAHISTTMAALTGNNFSGVFGDGRGAVSTANIYQDNVMYSAPPLTFNDDVSYWSNGNNKALDPLYIGPAANNLYLQPQSPAAGYFVSQRFLPRWTVNAGAYQ